MSDVVYVLEKYLSLLNFGCPPDNLSIILGYSMLVLVIPSEQKTTSLKADPTPFNQHIVTLTFYLKQD